MPWYITLMLAGLYGSLLILYLVERHLNAKLEEYTKSLERRNTTLHEDLEELRKQLNNKS